MGSRDYDEAYRNYTRAELLKHKKEAFHYYKEQKGECSVKVLSRRGKVPQTVIRQWMKEEDWASKVKEDPEDKIILSEETKDFISSHAEDYGLTEAEEAFCYHFVKTRNATASALKAGYSSSFSHNKAYMLLKEERVSNFIKDIRNQICTEIFVDAADIVNMYSKIAFADITDFVTFGPRGVRPKSSESVDGQVVCKIKEGRDGVSIELADRMRALEKLSNYLGVTPQDLIDKMKAELLEGQREGEIDNSLKLTIIRKEDE